MPPFLPRKHLRSPSPGSSPTANSVASPGRAAKAPTRKETVFDAIDNVGRSRRSAQQAQQFAAKLIASDDDESSLSSLSSSEVDFEDVPQPKRRKTKAPKKESDDEEEIEFEDVQAKTVETSLNDAAAHNNTDEETGDLDLTLTKETRVSITNPYDKKRAPTKIERGIRNSAHKLHVQYLLWHNTIRNGYTCDKQVQEILLKQLGPGVEKEIAQWRRASGLEETSSTTKSAPKSRVKAKGKSDARRGDWGDQAKRQPTRQVDMSHGDPLFRLIKALTLYWKSRFRVTEPGLRKLGYMSLQDLDEVLKSFHNDPHDPELHGERIADIDEFRRRAKVCEGSRDLGAQLFTALLRAVGLETRMVVSLQPVGFGWSVIEEAPEKKSKTKLGKSEHVGSDDASDEEMEDVLAPAPKNSHLISSTKMAKPKDTATRSPDKSAAKGKGGKSTPIDLSEDEIEIVDDDTVVDITPARQRRGPSKSYENGLAPNYWSEVLSPVTNTWLPCSTLLPEGGAATNETLMAFFEPKGKKAEKAKQVMAYLIGYSADGTAKDVTTRYLKRHMWPGKTKGMRMLAEKIPVYGRHGKVKRYEHYDWFRTVMSGYERRDKDKTDADHHEDATDLKLVKPEKKPVKEGEETLASYKTSDTYVLEKHMRREEALLPGAQVVKIFTAKVGKNGSEDHNVYLRKDVVKCKTMETWHKEGRAPLAGEEPLKRVPYRVATTTRRRELAEAEAATGEVPLQGLYSWDQTDWIIPPPIVDGIIPKNNFGNMDVYVPSMVPVGAVHLPYKGTVKVCKQLGIDYAEAVTGFEFGGRMAIPVITGVVVAEANEQLVLDRWHEFEAERVRKEDEKKRVQCLAMWRKCLMGLRVLKRVRDEYGDMTDDNVDELNPWTNKTREDKIEAAASRDFARQQDEDLAGGFFPDGHEEEEASSFFPVRHESDEDETGGGGFVVEEDAPLDDAATSAGVKETEEDLPMLENLHEKHDNTPNGHLENKAISRPKSSSTRKAATTRKPVPKLQTKGNSRVKKKALASLDNDENNDVDSTSSLSEIESVPDASEMKPKSKSRTAGRRAPMAEGQRAMPTRQSARKTDTRSRYFEGSGTDEE